MFIALIMLIGAVVLFFEHKNKKIYVKVFDDFYEKTMQNKALQTPQKALLLEQMLAKNGYGVEKIEGKIIGKKKIFSLGWLLLTLFTYLLFYFYLQKPHVIVFNLSP
jgi:Na+/melibiose symporter-like transporter